MTTVAFSTLPRAMYRLYRKSGEAYIDSMELMYEEAKRSFPLRPGWRGVVQLVLLLALWVGGPAALIWWLVA